MVNYRVHKNPLLVPILSQMNWSTFYHPIPLRPILILYIQLRLSYPSSLIASCFPNNILYVFLLSITLAARSKARNVFARSMTGIVGSNPTQAMNVCVRLFCVCVVPRR
jgi:hypothetical protein